MARAQSLLTDYFAVNLTSLALRAPSRPNPAPRALPRLSQSVLSQFFPNAAMYLGELGSTGHLDQRRLQQFRQEHEEHRRIVELNARPEFLSRGPLRVHRVPQTNIQDPLPFLRPTTPLHYQMNVLAVARQAAAVAPVLQALWEDDYFARELLHADADVIERHFNTADRAFAASLGPHATAYVAAHGVDGGSLHFLVLPNGVTVPHGPGLDGFNAAVADDDAAAAIQDDAEDSVVEDVPATSDDILDGARSTTSVTSCESLSVHDSMPSLVDDSINDTPASNPLPPPSARDLASTLRHRINRSHYDTGEEDLSEAISRFLGRPLTDRILTWRQDVPPPMTDH
ncbi:hypothetical protein FB451DRAFT_1173181 [Mycena latifolia]|nr:hypothetical protein FB451DRAFT_1173181 [Mycena latifolia]